MRLLAFLVKPTARLPVWEREWKGSGPVALCHESSVTDTWLNLIWWTFYQKLFYTRKNFSVRTNHCGCSTECTPVGFKQCLSLACYIRDGTFQKIRQVWRNYYETTIMKCQSVIFQQSCPPYLGLKLHQWYSCKECQFPVSVLYWKAQYAVSWTHKGRMEI